MDGANQYLYDGEGRVCAVASAQILGGWLITQYIYDAEGNRVAKGAIQLVNGALSCDTTVNGFTPTAAYVIGPGGEQLTETDGQGNWQHTNVYAGGAQWATYDQRGLHFQLSDWLGTRRVQTDYAGNIEETCMSSPFGDGLACMNPPNPPASADDATEHHFTGKERDAESGNDYFEARYYSSTMGRFMSPDWSAKEEPVPYANLGDPQTLNLYQYVGNNPLSKADKDGHCYPFCTALLGAGLGALAEGVSELANGQKLSSGKILAAAVGGGVMGAITGPVGNAAEVGLLTRAVVQVGASVIGGAAERGLTGEKVISTEALKDAAAGALGGKVEKSAEKLAATEAAQKIIPAVVNTVIDSARRAVTPPSPPPPPPPPPVPQQKQ
jgi:RHS repeat-associated protein